MREPNERLLSVLPDTIRTLDAAKVPTLLIGGLAVHIRCAQLTDPDVEDLEPTDPQRIAMLVRSTNDIDLVVSEARVDDAVDALVRASFRRDPRVTPPPLRLRHGRDVVDLIPCAERDQPHHAMRPDLGEVLAMLADAWQPLALGDTVLRVATMDALVILKAVAWCARWLPSDLVDVGRIALLDRETSATARSLASRVEGLPLTVIASLRQLGDAFAHDGAAGPGAMASSLSAEFPGMRIDEDLDLEVRVIVSNSVRAMLGPALRR